MSVEVSEVASIAIEKPKPVFIPAGGLTDTRDKDDHIGLPLNWEATIPEQTVTAIQSVLTEMYSRQIPRKFNIVDLQLIISGAEEKSLVHTYYSRLLALEQARIASLGTLDGDNGQPP